MLTRSPSAWDRRAARCDLVRPNIPRDAAPISRIDAARINAASIHTARIEATVVFTMSHHRAAGSDAAWQIYTRRADESTGLSGAERDEGS
jgi:hypothetical protein